MFKSVVFLSKTVGNSSLRRCIWVHRPLQASYTSEEKLYILQKINERDLPSHLIGLNHATKIISFVEKNKVDSLEDLLNINGIGPRSLKKVCDKILEMKHGPKSDNNPPPKKKREVQFITPILGEAQKKALKTVVGVHIGYGNVAWALVNATTKNLDQWGFCEGHPENGHLFQTLHLVDKINKMIPAGDLYLFEDHSIARQRPDIFKNNFSAMLLTSLQMLRGSSLDNPVVALVKPTLKNKLFNSVVGSERVSIQNHVVDLMEERSTIDCISVPKDFKALYYSLKSTTREDLAQSLLLATSFIKVILNQRLPDDR